MKVTTILTHEASWAEASKLCVYAYSLIDDLPDEERFDMKADLRQHAFNLTNDIAEALASRDPHEARHSYEHALRDSYGLKNVLTMAKRVGFIKLEPDMMMALDHLAHGIITSIELATRQEETIRKQEYEQEQEHAR